MFEFGLGCLMRVTNHSRIQESSEIAIIVLVPMSWMHVNAPLSGSNAVSIAYNFSVTLEKVLCVQEKPFHRTSLQEGCTC
jgi:hypothetical protein